MTWHKIGLQCPKCKGTFTILTIGVAADGEILVEGLCVSCSIGLEWKFSMAKLICGAYASDLAETEQKKNPRKGFRPPLQITPPTITGDDKKFLRALGIDPQNGGKK